MLSRIEVQQLGQLPELITPEPLVLLGRVNNLRKDKKVLYNFGIQLHVGF
jgi:hypothetical protein